PDSPSWQSAGAARYERAGSPRARPHLRWFARGARWRQLAGSLAPQLVLDWPPLHGGGLDHRVHVTAQDPVRLTDSTGFELSAIDPRAHGLRRHAELRRDLGNGENVVVWHGGIAR